MGVAGCVDAKQGPDCCRACLGETRACAAKGMAAAYGAITPVAPVRRRRTQGLLVAIAAAISCALLIQLGSEMVQNDRRPLLLLKQAARMNMIPLDQSQMLCEGHFLDTATGIPEGAFSTLSHPGELEGYAEPLPPEMRAAIDTEVYGSMDPEKYQFAGCIDDGRVAEVKGAVGQYRREHGSLGHFAAGQDYPLPHGQWLVQQQ